MDRKTGSRVLITGISSGLGLALAKAYLKSDWAVYGLSRTEPKTLSNQDNFHFAKVDLAQTAAIPQKLEKLIHQVKDFDLVILNAGIIGSFGDMSEVPLSTMQEVMEVNLWANKIILDTLMNNKVRLRQVVAISSGASTSGARGWNAYGISKAALNMLISLYAKEQPETHFCALAPGVIDTKMQDYLCNLERGKDYRILEILKEKRSTPEMPEPDEAAENLMKCMAEIFARLPSGEFADIRKLTFS